MVVVGCAVVVGGSLVVVVVVASDAVDGLSDEVVVAVSEGLVAALETPSNLPKPTASTGDNSIALQTADKAKMEGMNDMR